MDRPTRIFRILAQYYWGLDGFGCTQGKERKKATATAKQLLKSVSTLLSSGICLLKRLGKPSRFSRVNALTGSFGLLWGVKIPDTMTDDMPEHDLPYLEMLYKFVSGKQSYYDLASTRHVEPQANIERMSEDERSDRPTRHERNIAEWRICGVDGVAYPVRTSPRHARQKKHWQISPVTRVRVRQRIRKWDGYLYNIDLFIYVERRLLAFIEG